jgi:hypothetical protein
LDLFWRRIKQKDTRRWTRAGFILGYHQDLEKAVKIPGENARRRTVVESSQPFEAHNFPAPEDQMLSF